MSGRTPISPSRTCETVRGGGRFRTAVDNRPEQQPVASARIGSHRTSRTYEMRRRTGNRRYTENRIADPLDDDRRVDGTKVILCLEQPAKPVSMVLNI